MDGVLTLHRYREPTTTGAGWGIRSSNKFRENVRGGKEWPTSHRSLSGGCYAVTRGTTGRLAVGLYLMLLRLEEPFETIVANDFMGHCDLPRRRTAAHANFTDGWFVITGWGIVAGIEFVQRRWAR